MAAGASSRSSALRCLSVSEITTEICNVIDPSKDLCSFALTCRLLLEPAMDSKWKTLKTLNGLMWTFPEDKRRDLAHGIPITDNASWVRPIYYGAKVRQLFQTQPSPLLSQPVNLLASFVPNLQSLSWFGQLGLPLPPEFALFPPSLQHITIIGGYSRSELSTFLFHLHTQCKQLRSFTFASFAAPPRQQWQEDQPMPENELIALLFEANTLETLSVDLSQFYEGPNTSVEVMGFLPLLTKLRLDLPRNFTCPPSLQETNSPCFPALQGLDLNINGPIVEVSLLMAALQTKSLDWIALNANRVSSTDDLGSVFKAIQKHSTLRTITISAAFRGVEADTVKTLCALSVHHIQPLLDLKRVKTFMLALSPGIISSESLRAMVQAWPRLTELGISPNYRPSFMRPLCDNFTMDDVRFLARHCPSLQQLFLHFSAANQTAIKEPSQNAESVASQNAENVVQCQLCDLTVESSNIGQGDNAVTRMVLELRAMFPKLRKLSFNDTGERRRPLPHEEDEVWETEMRCRSKQWAAVRDGLGLQPAHPERARGVGSWPSR